MKKIDISKLTTLDELLEWEYAIDPTAKAKIEAMTKELRIRIELRQTRKKAKISQILLAKKSGIPQRTISEIESGKRNPTVKTLAQLSAAMGKELEIRFV